MLQKRGKSIQKICTGNFFFHISLTCHYLGELADHLMSLHHVTRLLQCHRVKTNQDPEKIRSEAQALSSTLGASFMNQFSYWDNLTNSCCKKFSIKNSQPKKRGARKKSWTFWTNNFERLFICDMLWFDYLWLRWRLSSMNLWKWRHCGCRKNLTHFYLKLLNICDFQKP